MRRMLRHEVPVDDQIHIFQDMNIDSDPVRVEIRATTAGAVVEFWYEKDYSVDTGVRTFRVFGTGQPLPDNAHWAGTTSRMDGIVWHLFEITDV